MTKQQLLIQIIYIQFMKENEPANIIHLVNTEKWPMSVAYSRESVKSKS